MASIEKSPYSTELIMCILVENTKIQYTSPSAFSLFK